MNRPYQLLISHLSLHPYVIRWRVCRDHLPIDPKFYSSSVQGHICTQDYSHNIPNLIFRKSRCLKRANWQPFEKLVFQTLKGLESKGKEMNHRHLLKPRNRPMDLAISTGHFLTADSLMQE